MAVIICGIVYGSINNTYINNKQVFVDMATTLENAANASTDGMTEEEIRQQQILKTLPIEDIVEIINNSNNIAELFNSINNKRQTDPNFLSDQQFEDLKAIIEEYNKLHTEETTSPN